MMSDKIFELIMTHAWWILVLVLSATPYLAIYIFLFLFGVEQ